MLAPPREEGAEGEEKQELQAVAAADDGILIQRKERERERHANPPRKRTGVQQGDPADRAAEARRLEDRDAADEAVPAPQQQIPEDRMALEAERRRQLAERARIARDAERDDLVAPRP